MSELFNLVPKLKEQFIELDKLWEQAIDCGNEELAEQIQEELVTLNNMINRIEMPEIEMKRRHVSTEQWKEFHAVR